MNMVIAADGAAIAPKKGEQIRAEDLEVIRSPNFRAVYTNVAAS